MMGATHTTERDVDAMMKIEQDVDAMMVLQTPAPGDSAGQREAKGNRSNSPFAFVELTDVRQRRAGPGRTPATLVEPFSVLVRARDVHLVEGNASGSRIILSDGREYISREPYQRVAEGLLSSLMKEAP